MDSVRKFSPHSAWGHGVGGETNGFPQDYGHHQSISLHTLI